MKCMPTQASVSMLKMMTPQLKMSHLELRSRADTVARRAGQLAGAEAECDVRNGHAKDTPALQKKVCFDEAVVWRACATHREKNPPRLPTNDKRDDKVGALACAVRIQLRRPTSRLCPNLRHLRGMATKQPLATQRTLAAIFHRAWRPQPFAAVHAWPALFRRQASCVSRIWAISGCASVLACPSTRQPEPLPRSS